MFDPMAWFEIAAARVDGDAATDVVTHSRVEYSAPGYDEME
jgi:hypothetical protein